MKPERSAARLGMHGLNDDGIAQGTAKPFTEPRHHATHQHHRPTEGERDEHLTDWCQCVAEQHQQLAMSKPIGDVS